MPNGAIYHGSMTFVINYIKEMKFFFENSNEFFGKMTFFEFYIFLCQSHKMKFFDKQVKNFFLEKMINFRTITCVDKKNEGCGRC